MQDKPDLKIDWASHEAAKYACTNWHYSKCLPVGKLVKVGAWEDGKFIGVILFSHGANPQIGNPYGLKQVECVELTRVALTAHKLPVSKILAISLKWLKKQSPGIRLIVSYADSGQGHHGGIYQATNWIYNGFFSGESSVVVNGKVMHRKSAFSLFGTTRPKGSYNVPASGKHKYLMPLDKDMSAKIAPLAKPYPKRVKQAMTGDQPEQRRRDTDPPAPLHAENQPFAEVTHGN
jgi:hypothetical protein